jgi:hypothetical protein
MSGALDKLIEAVHAEVEDQRRYLDDIGRRLTGPVGVSRAMKDATGGLNRLLQRLEVLEALRSNERQRRRRRRRAT